MSALLVACVVVGCGRGRLDPDDLLPPARPLRAGDSLPDFTAPSLRGDTIALSMFRGKIVVVHLWAAQCASCREDLQWIRRAFDSLESRGVEVVTVSLDSAHKTDFVRRVVSENNLSHVILRDPGRTVWLAFGMSGVPPTILVDRRGYVFYIDERLLRPAGRPMWFRALERYVHAGERASAVPQVLVVPSGDLGR